MMRKLFRRSSTVVGLFLLGLLLIGITGWGVLAIYYSDLESPVLRLAIAGTFGLVGLVGAFVIQRFWLKGKPMPALPPIAIMSLIGFLIASNYLSQPI